MKLYFIFLQNAAREDIEAHLNQHYRRCTAMNQWVLDRDGNPAVYLDWYVGFEKE